MLFVSESCVHILQKQNWYKILQLLDNEVKTFTAANTQVLSTKLNAFQYKQKLGLVCE